jgi:PTH1 family peptidyl-tRNA hydrolase
MYELIVALGNPGSQYEKTKHNVAWMILDDLKELRSANWKNKYKSEYAEVELFGKKRWFLKPQTYMNLSGEAVQAFCHFFKIDIKKILVVHDELDIPLGQVHFKNGGGIAGHNGLKSIVACMGTQDFARMRIGIGRPTVGDVSDWVLTPFRADEAIKWSQLQKKCSEILVECIQFDLNTVSGKWNKKDLLN